MAANGPDDRAALLGLDHVVIAVDALDRAVDDYRALGFTVLPGGEHPGRTSHNALVVFDDGAYFELIAWRAPAPQERWWRVLQAHGEGLVDFALWPRDTSAALAAARARGLHTLVGPVDGGRLRPDGERLQWQTARHATPDLPFLCGDITPRALRVPEGPARQHANGACGVAELRIAVADLETTLGRLAALLGPAIPLTRAASAGPVQGAAFTLGRTRFVLDAPAADTPADHPLRQRLAGRGEGPWAVALHVLPGAMTGALDPERSHGAALTLQHATPA